MHIYVVASGDSIWSISRKFGVSPDAVIYSNQLRDPNSIVVGQALVIPVYSVRHTVRAGQTVTSIARSLQISPETLISQNPSITNPARIYPGQVLTVTFPHRQLGTTEVNGYAYPSITPAVLDSSLPYLTYLSPFSWNVRADGSLIPLNDRSLITSAYNADVYPLMTLTNLNETSGGFSSDIMHELVTNRAVQDAFLQNLLTALNERQYYGVNIDFEYIYPFDKQSYEQFLRRMTDALHRVGYLVTAALAPKVSADQQGILYTSHDYAVIGRIVDIVIIMTYEWGYTYGPPLAVAPIRNVRQVLDYAVTAIPPGKLFMSIPNYGYDWKVPFRQGTAARVLSNPSAAALAAQYGAPIMFDEISKAPHFNYTDSDGQRHEVWFEDARSLEAKYALIAEYGLAGVSIWTLNLYFRTAFLVLQSMYSVRKTPSRPFA